MITTGVDKTKINTNNIKKPKAFCKVGNSFSLTKKNSLKNNDILRTVVVKTKSALKVESFVIVDFSKSLNTSFVFLYKLFAKRINSGQEFKLLDHNIETKKYKNSIGQTSQTKIKIENQKNQKKKGPNSVFDSVGLFCFTLTPSLSRGARGKTIWHHQTKTI